MSEISIPEKLKPIVQAFFAESEDVAKSLIVQASNAIYGINDGTDPYAFGGRTNITKDELQSVCALMHGIKPKDMLEALFAAQIVVSHMLGMRKLANGGNEDSRMGLKLLRFSNEALCQLQKKRAGGMQNITVNYNYSRQASDSLPTLTPHDEIEHAD